MTVHDLAVDPDGRPLLTLRGAHRLAWRVVDIRDRLLPGMRELLHDDPDGRMLAEYERLMEEMVQLDAQLDQAVVVGDEPFDGRVQVGVRVQVTMPDGTTEWVRPVHPLEAPLDDERISVDSPLGLALLGARVGSVVWVGAPHGVWAARVLDIDPSQQGPDLPL